jgi:hypothetical protein
VKGGQRRHIGNPCRRGVKLRSTVTLYPPLADPPVLAVHLVRIHITRPQDIITTLQTIRCLDSNSSRRLLRTAIPGNMVDTTMSRSQNTDRPTLVNVKHVEKWARTMSR